MNNHPINLALRFLLELAALFILGFWGAHQATGFMKYVWMLGLPVAAAAVWGIFRVENDPGKAPIVVPGIVRLLIEVAYFSTAVSFLYQLQYLHIAIVFGIIVILHYCVSYDRVIWLIKQ